MFRLRSVAVGALMCVGFATQALAHAHLKGATPAQNSVITAVPDALRLQFTEGLELAFTGLTLDDAHGKAIPTGRAALAAGDDATLLVPVAGPIAAGVYTVNWHALSKDGHKTQGSYTFTLKP